VGDPASSWMLFIIGYILIAGSYVFYHRKPHAASTENHVEI
jgi:hypothetical protein